MVALAPTSMASTNQGTPLKINMQILSSTSEYTAEEAYVEYYQVNTNILRAAVISRLSGDILEEYEEVLPSITLKSGYMTVSMRKDFNPTRHLSTKMRVDLDVDVYREYIGGKPKYHILDVVNADHYLIGSGSYIMESTKTTVNRFTSTYVDVQPRGVLVVSQDDTFGLEMGFEYFKSLNFSMSGSSTTYWYGRLAYSSNFRLEII